MVSVAERERKGLLFFLYVHDGSLAGAISHDLAPVSEHFVVLRFDSSLVFINAAYFEQAVLKALSEFSDACAVLVIGNGINSIDATGEEKLRELAEDQNAAGVKLMFAGLKKPVRDALDRAGLDRVNRRGKYLSLQGGRHPGPGNPLPGRPGRAGRGSLTARQHGAARGR